MANINVIACDPGKTGSFCFLSLSDNKPPLIAFKPNETPVEELDKWLKDLSVKYHITMAMTEDVHSVRMASAKANFTFGGNVREAEVLLRLQSFGFDKVQPKAWQKYIGITKKKGVKRTPAELKKEVAEKCKSLYPGCPIYGPKGGLLDGRSDALMIAHYCAHKYK